MCTRGCGRFLRLRAVVSLSVCGWVLSWTCFISISATELLSPLAQADPSLTKLYWMAERLAATGSHGDAILVMKRLHKIADDRKLKGEFLLHLAEEYTATDCPELAESTLRRVVSETPMSIEAVEALEGLRTLEGLSQEEHSERLEALAAVCEGIVETKEETSYGSPEEALLVLAYLSLNRRDGRQLERLVEELDKDYFSTRAARRAHLLLSEFYHSVGDTDKGLDELRVVLERSPKRGPCRAAALRKTGDLLASEKQYAEALEMYDKFLQEFNTHYRAPAVELEKARLLRTDREEAVRRLWRPQLEHLIACYPYTKEALEARRVLDE